jgi:hypothetical protein
MLSIDKVKTLRILENLEMQTIVDEKDAGTAEELYPSDLDKIK